jgi:cyclic pyranopterin monophosphate synthase
MSPLTHIDDEGRVRMVDVSAKPTSLRTAIAEGNIRMRPETFNLIQDQKVKKGNVLETARIAGVMAAKRTAELIPMCHPLNITHAQIDFTPQAATHTILITASVRIQHQTGVEMEALTAVSVAALTIYDMCKAYDRDMTISNIRLMHKSGGKSGIYDRASDSAPGSGA